MSPEPPREVVLRDGPLTLRAPRREEAELYARWWSDEEVLWGFCAEPRTAAEILAAFDELEHEARDIGHWIDWVIEIDGRPAGYMWFSHWDLDAKTIDMNLLLGEPEFRRHGWGRRAIRLLAKWAFPAMELERIYLCPREDHVPALRSYLAAGAHVGELREDVMSWRGETVVFRETYLNRGNLGEVER
jgi:RimJ/RimL family protein N-acetyltransferase